MPVDIHSFTSQFSGGGARLNLFQVQITNPVDGSQDNVIPFRAKAADLPVWQTEELKVSFMGRQIYYAGVRQPDSWNITIIEDSNLLVRNALESWQNWINLQEQNVRGFTTEADSAYKSVAQVQCLDKLGNVSREYTLYGLWPVTVASINLSWDTDNIMEYGATFRYDYFEISNGYSGNAADPGTIGS
jgi:hypothetical protein